MASATAARSSRITVTSAASIAIAEPAPIAKLAAENASRLYVLQGAEAFHKGASNDFNQVGVSAPDPHTLRVTLGWAWTYLVVAELVAANKGLGYFILNSMRGLFTDQIFLGIIVIGLLGLISDQVFKLLRNWLLPWAV